jgi:hypothetical protein
MPAFKSVLRTRCSEVPAGFPAWGPAVSRRSRTAAASPIDRDPLRRQARKAVAAASRSRGNAHERLVANSIVRDVGAGRANAIVCGSVLSRALRVRPSISAEYRAES